MKSPFNWRQLSTLWLRFAFRLRHPGVPIFGLDITHGFYSQKGQDGIVAGLLLQHRRSWPEKPIVLDIGCNHPVTYSNSLFLERYWNFTTIAVDPIAAYQAEWNELRPSAIFEPLAVGKETGEAELNIVETFGQTKDMFSFITGAKAKSKSRTSRKLRVGVDTVSRILDRHGIGEVVFCSIDVEGAELDVLKGIDFSRQKIWVLCVENNSSGAFGDEEIRAYLGERHYKFVARLGRLDDLFIHQDIKG